MDAEIQDAFTRLGEAEAELRSAWQNREPDPDGVRDALKRYNRLGEEVARLMNYALGAQDAFEAR